MEYKKELTAIVAEAPNFNHYYEMVNQASLTFSMKAGKALL